jgi:GNAT superfamily N-acetyltransferase
MTALEPFTRATTVVDWRHRAVRSRARDLARGRGSATVRACFEWVRDRIPHTVDHGLERVTCAASEVLREGTGFCYAKSHLLAALLRANGIPTGFVYQRLALDDRGERFCLHGLNAVWLPQTGWYRLDARGNRDDLHAACDPPREVLPYACRRPGERLFAGIRAEPLPLVIEALRTHRTRAVLEANLPDVSDVSGQGGSVVAFKANASAAIELRPYRTDDAEAVVRLWWASWHSMRPGLRHPHTFDDFRVRWASQIVRQHDVMVAADAGVIVGFAAAAVADGELDQIFVDPGRKRQGIGRRLFAWAQRAMPDGFVLHTLVDNVTSRAFYEHHGLSAGDTRINPVNGMATIEYRWDPRTSEPSRPRGR